ncbi:MAG: ABC transporter substrate-binding protein [Bacillales bacterium]|nr:ABC transporter substrate-binding protein [Bacillales bacterium]
MKKMVHSIVSILCVGILLLAGCSNNQSNGNANNATNQPKTEIVVALTSEPDGGFDPVLGYAAYGSPLIQSTLLDLNEEAEITKDLATDYTVSEDGKTWTFSLREDVKFTDNEPLTAEDVVFTYESAKNSGSTVDLVQMKSVKALNDYTVEFTLMQPQSTFLFTTASIGIVPKHAYSSSYGQNPIGSGPYKVLEYKQGQQVIFVKNEDYYGTKGNFEKVTVLFMSEDQAFAAAKSGQVDVAQTNQTYAKETVNAMDLQKFQTVDNRGISFITIPSGSEINGHPAGNDVTSQLEIRQAINLALNREALVTDALEGFGRAAYSNVDHLPWWNENTVITQNVDKAKQILSNAGWKDTDNDGILEKNRLKAQFDLYYNAGDGARQALVNAVTQQLKEIGIHVNPIGGSWDDIERGMYANPVLFGWGNRNPMELYYLYHSKNIGFDWYNTNAYKNEAVDQALDKALISGDMADWKKAQEPLIEDLPWAWLVNVDHLYFVNEKLSLGNQPIHPHSHALDVLCNLEEWIWKSE